MKQVLTHTLAAYLGAGLFAALIMNAAIPALNWKGMAYIAAAWPGQVYCARVDQNCQEPPQWAFSFEVAQ